MSFSELLNVHERLSELFSARSGLAFADRTRTELLAELRLHAIRKGSADAALRAHGKDRGTTAGIFHNEFPARFFSKLEELKREGGPGNRHAMALFFTP